MSEKKGVPPLLPLFFGNLLGGGWLPPFPRYTQAPAAPIGDDE